MAILSPIYIPTPANRPVRDYAWIIEDVTEQLKRAKQWVKHLLLRREARYEAGKLSWTKHCVQWLCSLSCELPDERETLTEYYEEVTWLDEKRVRIEQQIEQIVEEAPYNNGSSSGADSKVLQR
jgi:hypothetical protein